MKTTINFLLIATLVCTCFNILASDYALSSSQWQSIKEKIYLKSSNSEADDRFGFSVAISKDTVAIGAYREDSNSQTINGNQNDNSQMDSGAVYVFVNSNGQWQQQAYIKPQIHDSFDGFGWSVALDGDTLAIGAYREDSNSTGVNVNAQDNSAKNSGAVYIYNRDKNKWKQQAYIKPSNTDARDEFGYSIALDNNTLVVGAIQEDSKSNEIDGCGVNNLALNAGAAYVFIRDNKTWKQQAYLKASNTDANDKFGVAVAIDKDTIVVGASQESSEEVGVDGESDNNLALNAGAAYVFYRSYGKWNEQAYLKASNTETNDLFGLSVAIDANTIAVGASSEDSNASGVGGDQSNNNAQNSGAVYIFQRNKVQWQQQAYIKATNTESNDGFGATVALVENTLAVGATWEDSAAMNISGNEMDNTNHNAGAVYIYTRISNIWSAQVYVKSMNPDTLDEFSRSIALTKNTLLVGSHFEDSNTREINGNSLNNKASASGAAYIFRF